MNTLESHRDDLRDLCLRGEATAAERAIWERHRDSCATCRFETAITAEAREAPDDTALTGARIDAALATLVQPPISRRAAVRRLKPRTWLLFAAALSLAVSAAAAAGWWRWVRLDAPARLVPSAVLARSAALLETTHTRLSAPPLAPTLPDVSRVAPAAAVGPALTDPPAESQGASARFGHRAAHNITPAPAPAPPAASAPELFTAANIARRAGNDREAIGLYNQLLSQYPRSPEAELSSVTFGRLLNERNEDPRRALALFNEYLSAQPHGSVAELALVGKATALRALGRTAEEQATWRTLLSQYPDSIHAATARARLGE